MGDRVQCSKSNPGWPQEQKSVLLAKAPVALSEVLNLPTLGLSLVLLQEVWESRLALGVCSVPGDLGHPASPHRQR